MWFGWLLFFHFKVLYLQSPLTVLMLCKNTTLRLFICRDTAYGFVNTIVFTFAEDTTNENNSLVKISPKTLV